MLEQDEADHYLIATGEMHELIPYGRPNIMRIAIVSVRYGIEVSPTVKGIALYGQQRGDAVTILADRLCRDPSFHLQGILINTLVPVWLERTHAKVRAWRPFRGRGRILSVLNWMGEKEIVRELRSRAKTFDFVFGVEIVALHCLAKAGFDLGQVAFLSLESTGLLEHYARVTVNALLSRVAFCMIQSPARRQNLIDYLGISLDCEFLPVSMVPPRHKRKRSQTEAKTLRLVHSGYFAPWSNVIELVEAFLSPGFPDNVELVLQGHLMGTEDYYDRVLGKVHGSGRIRIDTNYYDDDAHAQFLAQFDIGIAFYPNVSGSKNWENMIFSSGKLAAYLWAGLAVITNIRHDLTCDAPFLYVKDLSPESLRKALDRYRAAPDRYHKTAREIAKRHYDIRKYLDKIWERILLQAPRNEVHGVNLASE